MTDLQDKAGTRIEEKDLAFCVALAGSSTQVKRSSHFEDFFPLVERSSIAWVDIKVDDSEKEVVETAVKVGFSELLPKQLLARLKDRVHFQGGYEDLDTEMGVLFPTVSVEGFDITVNPIFMLLRKGLILTIRSSKTHIFHDLHRYAETFLKRLPKNRSLDDRLTLLLIRIIDENNQRNFEQLQEIDRGSEDLAKGLKTDGDVRPTAGDRIYEMNLTLVKYLSCLWATSDTLFSLRHGDADLISDATPVLDKIGSLINEVHQQLNLAEHISDVLASGLQSLQSIYNNQLQDRNNLLSERNNLLQDKNNKLADLNNALQEKNNLLQEKNNTLQEYSNQLQEKNNKLQDYNNRLTLLNNRLTVLNNRITLLGGFLAIISAGFIVPNTIATVMSQTTIFVFSPADVGWYLALILASTIVTIVLVWLWVKSRGLLPKAQEENEERLIYDVTHAQETDKQKEQTRG
jgi:magnesium transporter